VTEVLFPEKKNKKTFVCLVPRTLTCGAPGAASQEQKLFASFFKKEGLAYVSSANPT
jgi:hypothetical protein